LTLFASWVQNSYKLGKQPVPFGSTLVSAF
jgi:hypothetical protein